MPECSSVIINCIDFRFQTHVQELIKSLSISEDVDVINIVGGGAKINNYKVNGKSMLDISCSLHKPKNIILTGHHDCGGGTTLEELKNTEKEIKKVYPECNISSYWFKDSEFYLIK